MVMCNTDIDQAMGGSPDAELLLVGAFMEGLRPCDHANVGMQLLIQPDGQTPQVRGHWQPFAGRCSRCDRSWLGRC